MGLNGCEKTVELSVQRGAGAAKQCVLIQLPEFACAIPILGTSLKNVDGHCVGLGLAVSLFYMLIYFTTQASSKSYGLAMRMNKAKASRVSKRQSYAPSPSSAHNNNIPLAHLHLLIIIPPLPVQHLTNSRQRHIHNRIRPLIPHRPPIQPPSWRQ